MYGVVASSFAAHDASKAGNIRDVTYHATNAIAGTALAAICVATPIKGKIPLPKPDIKPDLKPDGDAPGAGALEAAGERTGPAAAKPANPVVGPARTTASVLDSFRKLSAGKNKTVRTAGSVGNMRAIFEAWTVGAERLPARGPKIPGVYQLPDGGVVQWRNGSPSGGPTIDIDPAAGAPRRVHLADGVPW